MSKKLIEVALPLDTINKACAYEKMPGIGPHPRGIHHWWARRPLAAARAVLFAQLVDDPSGYLDDEADIEKERNRLFKLLEELVKWKNSNNETILEQARAEIRRSWTRMKLGRDIEKGLSNADIRKKLKTGDIEPMPAFHDPFAGGGALPLEAQRLGLEAWASDLNPIAVMINKAMIEFPPQFAKMPPVNPEARRNNKHLLKEWKGVQGIANDIIYYGNWVRTEAEKRIGHLYPAIRVTTEMVEKRHDLRPYLNKDLNIIAWIWARTVRSPNPAYNHVHVPLMRSFKLKTKKNEDVWLDPIIRNDKLNFQIKKGKFSGKTDGTIRKNGAICILSGSPISLDYVREEGKAGRIGKQLIAIVCEGTRERIYLEANEQHQIISQIEEPKEVPDTNLPLKALSFRVQAYGMLKHKNIFTNRQLKSLATFSQLIKSVKGKIDNDLEECEEFEERTVFKDGDYASVIAAYLSFGLDRCVDFNNTLTRWVPGNEKIMGLFNRHAIPMVWDFGEGNILGNVVGSFFTNIEYQAKCIETLPALQLKSKASQDNAITQSISENKIISTDPPYYDNIGYADLSDFFYVWSRLTLKEFYPRYYSTLTVPKEEELIATPFRHTSKRNAENFFMSGMQKTISNIQKISTSDYPITIYYAFKQSELKNEELVSTGWQTFLEAILNSGYSLTGTWPLRSEQEYRMISMGTNALASSIVLVCRKRPENAEMITRRQFQALLNKELPLALRTLQDSNIAPVDLAQSAIGPGMAIFSQYSQVLEPDGSPMKVRTALALINEVLAQTLSEQEGDLDEDTRWALAWYEQYRFGEGPFGVAETLCTAKNTSINGMVEAVILKAKSGKVALLSRDELDATWNPAKDKRLTIWEAMQHLIRVLENDGEDAAARLLKKMPTIAEPIKELAYRLYQSCEQKGWADEARSYNGLVISWPELQMLASKIQEPSQAALDL